MRAQAPQFDDSTPTEDAGELHITSLVLHAHPKRGLQVRAAIAAVPGSEVHAVGPTGKIVVTLEARSASEIMAGVAALQAIDGVFSAVLVYQHAEPIEQMDERL